MSIKKPPVYNDYTPLPGSGRMGFSRAYLGPDHILSLRQRGTAEHARRFYYKDITGLRCQVTTGGRFVASLLFCAALLPLLPMAVFGMPALSPAIVCGVWSALCLIALAIHWGRGPTCATWIHTTNHTEQLPSVKRYRAAQRALETLAHRVNDARGGMPNGVAEDGPWEFTPVPATGAATFDIAERPSTRVVTLCLAVPLILALSYLLDYQINWEWKNTLDGMASVLMALATPFAMYRCFQRDIPTLTRWAMGVLTAFFATLFPQMLGLGVFLAALDPTGFEEAAEKFNTIASLSPSDGPVYYLMLGYHTLSILIMGGCALVGLLVRARKGPASSDPEGLSVIPSS